MAFLLVAVDAADDPARVDRAVVLALTPEIGRTLGIDALAGPSEEVVEGLDERGKASVFILFGPVVSRKAGKALLFPGEPGLETVGESLLLD